MRLTDSRACAVALAFALAPALAVADGANTASAYEDDGKHFNSDDIPTFNVDEDGAVDWYTFSGFRRYHSECHVCHGPDGMGSTYAPPIREAVMRLDYYEFMAVVAAGQEGGGGQGNSIMPAFGLNDNVMCYLDDIWIYLRARGEDAVPRGRPAKRADKPESFVEHENECMG